MLDNFFISREEVNKIKVSQKNPFGLTKEKIIKSPRSFNTSQIKEAIENINLFEEREKSTPNFLFNTIKFLLGEFFLYMHQSGLYNRQLNLWKTLGNITQCKLYRLKKGLIKKQLLDTYIIDCFIDPKAPCIKVILMKSSNNKDEATTKLLKDNLLRTLSSMDTKRLKGVFYILNDKIDPITLNRLDIISDAFDPIARYESILNWTEDVRLNVISYKDNEDNCSFEHIYPQIIKATNRESLTKK